MTAWRPDRPGSTHPPGPGPPPRRAAPRAASVRPPSIWARFVATAPRRLTHREHRRPHLPVNGRLTCRVLQQLPQPGPHRQSLAARSPGQQAALRRRHRRPDLPVPGRLLPLRRPTAAPPARSTPPAPGAPANTSRAADRRHRLGCARRQTVQHLAQLTALNTAPSVLPPPPSQLTADPNRATRTRASTRSSRTASPRHRAPRRHVPGQQHHPRPQRPPGPLARASTRSHTPAPPSSPPAQPAPCACDAAAAGAARLLAARRP